MIEVRGLEKRYGALVAVDGIEFRAQAGTIFGLLGPNGAGKTTTISCLSGLLSPDAGQIAVNGHDVIRDRRSALSQVGIAPQEIALYQDLTAEENLRYWGGAYGLSKEHLRRRVKVVLEEIGLSDRATDKVSTMSGGMKRRLNLGCALVHEPRVILLDEPTAGVDPQSRVRLLDLVRKQAAAGVCVLYTTHYMEEAEALCHDIAVMDHGRIIAHGTLEALRQRTGQRDLVRLSGDFSPGVLEVALSSLEDKASLVHQSKNQVSLRLEGGAQNLPRVMRAFDEAGAVIDETVMTRPSLESLFIELTGRELRD